MLIVVNVRSTHRTTLLSSLRSRLLLLGCAWLGTAAGVLNAGVIYATNTPYNRVLVIDNDGLRILSFDGSQETRMSLADSTQGHFDYTELFHLAWLWNSHPRSALIIGLGGGSVQRSFLLHYPEITVESVEIDPAVVSIATRFFHVPLAPRHRVHVVDGHEFLRRSRNRYDLILMDAYTTTPQGSTMPPHLATRKQAQLIREHLTTNGVAAYNLIGTLRGWKSDQVETLASVLAEVFPTIYAVPARQSMNVVLFGVQSRESLSAQDLRQRAAALVHGGTVTLPHFLLNAGSLRQLSFPPRASPRAPPRNSETAPRR